MQPELEALRSELTRARGGVRDLETEYAALADPENVALDDEHDSEGSTVGYERARVGGLLERSRTRVADLEAALRRAQSGTYGICASCHGDIGAERLSALPATRLCIGCAR
jgi:RNA polymerase-binding transcription factor DksA